MMASGDQHYIIRADYVSKLITPITETRRCGDADKTKTEVFTTTDAVDAKVNKVPPRMKADERGF
jgi:hypothetical protein